MGGRKKKLFPKRVNKVMNKTFMAADAKVEKRC